MFNRKYVSVKEIIDNVMDGKLYRDLSFPTAVKYAVQCYRLLASEKAEVTKPFKVQVVEYRFRLPDDFERVQTVVKTDEALTYVQRMRANTGDFGDVRHCTGSPDLHCASEYVYSLNDNYVTTNFEEGHCFMIYKALKMCKDGFPMIPDQVDVKLATEFYIKWRHLDNMASDEPFVQRQKQEDQQNYTWHIGKAQSAMTDMSWDEYRALANSMSRFFIEEDHYNSFFNELGSQEYIRVQR